MTTIGKATEPPQLDRANPGGHMSTGLGPAGLWGIRSLAMAILSGVAVAAATTALIWALDAHALGELLNRWGGAIASTQTSYTVCSVSPAAFA